jgi:hypothetical protein
LTLSGRPLRRRCMMSSCCTAAALSMTYRSARTRRQPLFKVYEIFSKEGATYPDLEGHDDPISTPSAVHRRGASLAYQPTKVPSLLRL